MHLFLLRHADADTIAAHDEERFLSAKGIAQAKKVARFFETQELPLPVILASPILRAKQTAEIVSSHLSANLIMAPWMACGMTPPMALAELRAFRHADFVMLVGHEPDFSLLAAHLLGLPSSQGITIRKASLSLLLVSSLAKGGARLDFSLPVRFM